MMYKKVDREVLEQLRKIAGLQNVFVEEDELSKYSHDESAATKALPEVVVKAENTLQISQILALANKRKIPVTPRGAGTGLCGGAIPIYGGIVLSLEKMNKILEVDRENFMVSVEPGVLIMDLHTETEKLGFLYPPDPGQKSGFIGGNISTNAGGMRAVKYGVTRDFVEALEVVLPSGEIMNLGGKTVKSSTGFSLIDLIIGSEGILGIVTKATLRLVPLPKLRVTLYVPFNYLNDATRTVMEIIRQKIVPSAIEFVDQASIQVAERFQGKPMPNNKAPAYLIVLIDGNVREDVNRAYETVAEICLENHAIDVLIADTPESQQRIWDGRSCIIDAAKAEGVVEVLDAVVPRNKIPDLVSGLNFITGKYGIERQNFGHAGDGNVHTNLIKGKMTDEEWNLKAPRAIEEIYKLSISLGGKISGEHGIGLIRKGFLPMALGKEQIELMKGIKRIFDPNNILNPGKVLDMV